MLDRAVFIDVTGDAKGGELAHLLGVRDGAAEDQYRQAAVIELANRPHQIHARRVGQSQIEDDEIDLRQIGVDARQQLGSTLDGDGFVARAFHCRAEAIAHERGVISDDDGLGGDRSSGHLSTYRASAPQTIGEIADPRRFSLYSRSSCT